MSIKAGVSYCLLKDSFQSGQMLAKQVFNSFMIDAPDFLIMFCSVNHDHRSLLDGISSILGKVPLIGCTGAGVLSSRGDDKNDSHSATMMAIKAPNIKFHHFKIKIDQTQLDRYEDLGRLIALKIKSFQIPTKQKQLLFLFPSSLIIDLDQVLQSLQKELGFHLPCVGGMSSHDTNRTTSFQFHDEDIIENGICGVVMEGDFQFSIEKGHGCGASTVFHSITSPSGQHLTELDGKSALSQFDTYLKKEVGINREKLDDPSRIFHEAAIGEKITINTSLGIREQIRVKSIKSLTNAGLISSSPVKQGQRICFMRREYSQIKTATLIMGLDLVQNMTDSSKGIYFYFNSVGRTASVVGKELKDVENLMEVLGKDKKLIGLFTFGEVAPIGDKNYQHNHTGVLVAIE